MDVSSSKKGRIWRKERTPRSLGSGMAWGDRMESRDSLGQALVLLCLIAPFISYERPWVPYTQRLWKIRGPGPKPCHRETSIVWWVVLNILKTSQRQLQGQRRLALLPPRILSFKPGLSKYFSIFPIYSKLSTQIHPWSVWVRKELYETVDWSVGATGWTRRHTGRSWVHSSSVTEMAVLMS